MSGGAMAAENAMLVAQSAFDGFVASESDGPRFLGALVDEIHTVIRLTGLTSEREPHCTFAAVLFQPDRIDWCHVGDSRIYHFRGRDLLHCSRDHTLAQRMIDEGRMSPERARLHPSAGRLTNALGSREKPAPEMGMLMQPSAGDSFLICSDGLWNYLGAEELGQLVEHQSPRHAAATMIARARQRADGHGDNCSLVLMKLREGPA